MHRLREDLPILQRHENFTYVHCPSGRGAGGSNGSQPFPELLAAGVNTALGHRHALERLRREHQARRAQRTRALLPRRDISDVPMKMPTIWDAVDAATRERRATGLGREDLGRIEAGAKADLCTIDVSGLLVGWRRRAAGAAQQPAVRERPLRPARDDRRQFPGGSTGKLVVDDNAAHQRRGGAAVSRLWEQLRAEDWFGEPPASVCAWPSR